MIWKKVNLIWKILNFELAVNFCTFGYATCTLLELPLQFAKNHSFYLLSSSSLILSRSQLYTVTPMLLVRKCLAFLTARCFQFLINSLSATSSHIRVYKWNICKLLLIRCAAMNSNCFVQALTTCPLCCFNHNATLFRYSRNLPQFSCWPKEDANLVPPRIQFELNCFVNNPEYCTTYIVSLVLPEEVFFKQQNSKTTAINRFVLNLRKSKPCPLVTSYRLCSMTMELDESKDITCYIDLGKFYGNVYIVF